MNPLDLQRLKVFPLSQRKSLSSLERILVDPDSPPPACSEALRASVAACADTIAEARRREAGVVLLYGAHLVKNGLLAVVNRLIERGWVTHLATNGAGAIHDWELAFLGRTEESVRENIPTGTFGTWDETGRNINLSLLAGALHENGFGLSLGKFIQEDGVTLPKTETLSVLLRSEPEHPLSPARAELLQAMLIHKLPAGRMEVKHQWKSHSILATAARFDVPMTVHPGIGYDIISCHPMFNGAAIGRAAQIDFRLLCAAVEQLEGGVALSVGSAIMAPQVFEKSVSCVNNLRVQAGRPALAEHTIYVVDIQDGGGWDWSKGEPPKTNPAYYLRFCKSFSRMGGTMNYLACDNGVFLRNLLHELEEL